MSADLDKEGAQEGGPSETSGAASSDYDKPGVAKLKAQYILQDYRPTVDKEYVSVRDQLSMTSDTAGNHGDPPAKRVKLAGRNKKRPKGKRADPSDKICPYFLKDESCTFGDRCKYSHDKVNFMATKPKDISDVCYLFETYGKCPYGLSCRFGGQHIAENNNVVKEGHDEMKSRKDVVRNVLTKDTQVLLWKRRYDFSKADTVINEICPEANSYSRKKNDNKTTGKLPGSAQSVQEKTPPTEPVTTSTGSVTKNTDTTETSIREVPGNGAVETGVSPLDGEITVTSQCVEPNSSLETSECVTSNRPKAAAVETSTCDTLSVEQGSSGDTGTSIMVQSEGAGAQKPRLLEDEGIIKLRPQEKKKVDFAGKLYLAPLTTVGNLPFRRICKQFGADITCGEMAVCTNMLQGQSSEWALCKRHESEDIFGVQVCGAYPDSMTRCAQLINEHMDVDFVDINCGCPIDLIFNKGEGSALMGKVSKFEKIVTGMTSVLDVPLTVKIRTGIYKDRNIAHTLMPRLRDWGVSLVTLHGRSRVQRYTKTADWDYIQECAGYAAPMPVFGNGDVMSFTEAIQRRELTGISGLMIARGALIKPWLFREIKEQFHWDISANERLDILKDYTNFGLDHWGSDQQGVESTRRFMLEWLSFLYRYIPVGLLERVPQRINERPPYYEGRSDLETLMASPSCGDWVKISEMLLGPVPEEFSFLPKHKANAYK